MLNTHSIEENRINMLENRRFHVIGNGERVEFRSRLGILRTYTHDQWNMIWPKIVDRILSDG